MSTPTNAEGQLSENIILADADYVDQVAFNLIVNFERMLGRRIPQADMPRWAECVALDGGLRQGNHQTDVVLVHHDRRERMENFAPGHYATELNGQAFSGYLGEFAFSAVSTEGLAAKDDLYMDTLRLVLSQKTSGRLMLIPGEGLLGKVAGQLRQAAPDLHITLFAMQPQPAAPCRQELLGFSLMAALGIKSDEIQAE